MLVKRWQPVKDGEGCGIQVMKFIGAFVAALFCSDLESFITNASSAFLCVFSHLRISLSSKYE